MSWHPWRNEGEPRPPTQPELIRVCAKCQQPKPIARFRRYPSSPTPRRECRDCEYERFKAHRQRNPDMARERERRKRQNSLYNSRRRAAYRRRKGYTQDDPPRRYWSAIRVAVELGYCPAHVRHLVRSGALCATKDFRGVWRIDPSSVDAHKAR